MGILLNPELERRITEKIESGRYKSADEVVERSLELLDAREDAGRLANDELEPALSTRRPIWEIAAEIARRIPDEDAASLPRDLAANHDHYLYGAPKSSE